MSQAKVDSDDRSESIEAMLRDLRCTIVEQAKSTATRRDIENLAQLVQAYARTVEAHKS